MHAQAAAAAVSRTLRQATAVHHAQAQSMCVHSQAAAHHQAVQADRPTIQATTARHRVDTTEAATHQEVHPTQAAAAVQAQALAVAQAQAIAEAAVAQVPAAEAIAVAAAVAAAVAEEDK